MIGKASSEFFALLNKMALNNLQQKVSYASPFEKGGLRGILSLFVLLTCLNPPLPPFFKGGITLTMLKIIQMQEKIRRQLEDTKTWLIWNNSNKPLSAAQALSCFVWIEPVYILRGDLKIEK